MVEVKELTVIPWHDKIGPYSIDKSPPIKPGRIKQPFSEIRSFWFYNYLIYRLILWNWVARWGNQHSSFLQNGILQILHPKLVLGARFRLSHSSLSRAFIVVFGNNSNKTFRRPIRRTWVFLRASTQVWWAMVVPIVNMERSEFGQRLGLRAGFFWDSILEERYIKSSK